MARRPRKKDVLLLNGDGWQSLGKIEFNKAVSLLMLDKAVSIAPRQDVFVQGPIKPDGTRIQLPWPVCIRLKNYKYLDFDMIAPLDDVNATRVAIFHRDGFSCQYCGEAGATIDHVFPKSRGGENTWLNLVTCCQPCNSFKADRTPEEAGMKLFREPFVPPREKYAKEQKEAWDFLKENGLDLEDE